MRDTNSKQTFAMSNSVYKFLKTLALVVIPALGTLYFTLGSLWKLPNVEQIIGTMTALDTFLGVILGISTKAYNDSETPFGGHIVIKETETGGKLYSLEMDRDPSDLVGMKQITFRIGKPTRLHKDRE